MPSLNLHTTIHPAGSEDSSYGLCIKGGENLVVD